jgi:hypothetical protein
MTNKGNYMLTAILPASTGLGTSAPGTKKRKTPNSRKPLKDREPNHFERVIIPDLSDGHNCQNYLYQQNEMGHFKERPTAFLTMLYLTNFTWHKSRNNEDAPPGRVLSGKASIGKAAMATGMSRRTIERDYQWLEQSGWIDLQVGEYSPGEPAPYIIDVRLDASGHRDREKRRQLTQETEDFLKAQASDV